MTAKTIHADKGAAPEDVLLGLRRQAEALVMETAADGMHQPKTLSPDATQSMLHELQVQKIELQMQNEELHRAQLELDASRARYLELYDHAPVGYCTLGKTGLIVQANLTIATMLGIARGALMNRPLGQLIVTSDQPTYYLARQRLTHAGETQTAEVRMLRADTTLFWAQLVLVGTQLGSDSPGLHIAVSDVSERKRGEEALKLNQTLLKSDAFSRSIMDSVDAHIAVLDRNAVIVAVNAPWRRFALENSIEPGLAPPRTDIGTNYLDVCRDQLTQAPDEPALSAIAGIRAVLAGSSPRFSMEYRCNTPQRERWFNLVVTPFGGDTQGVVVSHTDISERIWAKQALVESEASLKQFMDALPAAAFIKSQDGSALLMNRYLEENYGVVDWRGKSVAEIFPPEVAEKMMADDRRTLEVGQLVVEEEVFDLSGRLRIFQTHKFVMNRAEKPPLLGGIALDITERKLIEAELLAARNAAERANNGKSRFIAAASHDLRQPLSALALYVGVLQSMATADNSKLIAKIRDCCDSLSELLTDLLDISKLDAGVVTPKLSDFDIDGLVASLVSVHSAEATLKGLRLRWRSSRQFAHTDQKLFLRIVGNIVANAIRYTDHGGVLLACRHQAGKYWLQVWDTGAGIPADKHALIFEEFTQLGDGSAGKGSGLGLAIVAKACALLGLELHLYSRPGRGSMFALELPIGREVAPPTAGLSQAKTRRTRIGVVENHAEMLDAIVLALQAAGHEVIGSTTGKELLERLGGHAPDIIVSDYRLDKHETGFDVIKALRASFGEALPALIITGDTNPALVRSMTSRGITIQYKPLKLDALAAFISQATNRRVS